MKTVKDIKEFLSQFPDDMEVVNLDDEGEYYNFYQGTIETMIKHDDNVYLKYFEGVTSTGCIKVQVLILS